MDCIDNDAVSDEDMSLDDSVATPPTLLAREARGASTARPTATDACAWAKALRCGSLEGKAP